MSDYARFWILYRHGGLYFDTDVEVIKPMDNIIARGPFMGCETEVSDMSVAPGLGLGCNPGLGLYADILELYSRLHFRCPDGSLNLKTVVEYTTELLVTMGLKNVDKVQQVAGIWIYPKEYFCPISPLTLQFNKTQNTRCIHHYAGSWCERSFLRKLGQKLLGTNTMRRVDAFRKKIK